MRLARGIRSFLFAAASGLILTICSCSSGSNTDTPAVAPSITTQPAVSQTVLAPAPATFTVVATGTAPLSYQWKKSAADIAGATNASYTTGPTSPADNLASYTVTVGNSAGSVTSNAAILHVNTPGALTGRVTNFATAALLAGATVTDGTVSVTTDANGVYTLNGLGASDRKAITISAPNYASTSKIVAVIAGVTGRADVALLPVGSSTTLNDQTAANTLTVPGSPARVALQAGSLATASGAAPTFPVKGNLTPIDPSADPTIMPGDYTTSTGTVIESYGALEANFVDATGAPLNLKSGQPAVIRIPVPAVYQNTAPPATMPAFYYNPTTGQWVQEGTLTLGGAAPNQYYEGSVAHFSYWNADQVYNTTCVTGIVVNNLNGSPVSGARVEAQGRDYLGTSSTYTSANGTFTLKVRANSQVLITATTADSLSQTEEISSGAPSTTNCVALANQLKLGSLVGSAKIKLTWGLNPADLDSHLVGPDALTPGTRFHVYYSNPGSLGLSPYAALDVDDTTSFGPEVITISRFTATTPTSVYSYAVRHYSGSGTIATSAARVELTLNGATSTFTPPAAPADGSLVNGWYWNVFNLSVNGAGVVTVTPVNTYTGTAPSISPNGSPEASPAKQSH